MGFTAAVWPSHTSFSGFCHKINGNLPSLLNLSSVHNEAVMILKSLDDPNYVENCLVNGKKALLWSGYVKMDGFWIYRTATSMTTLSKQNFDNGGLQKHSQGS